MKRMFLILLIGVGGCRADRILNTIDKSSICEEKAQKYYEEAKESYNNDNFTLALLKLDSAEAALDKADKYKEEFTKLYNKRYSKKRYGKDKSKN
jgi:hypothetical protein